MESLRYVFLGGEKIDINQISSWKKQSRCALVNSYGPTECTDVVSYHVIKDIEAYADGNIPIGKPIGNTRLYVFNEFMSLAPIGALGELYIGGVGVAGAYLNNSKLTDEKFISNPFSRNRDKKLYRTGDLARWLPDGNLEFIGRIDHQVKIRGIRIELGEIEYQLSKISDIKRSVVLARDDEGLDNCLVAYIVSDQLANVNGEAGFQRRKYELSKRFKNELKRSLPEHMIPGIFIFLKL